MPDGLSPAWPIGYDVFEPYYQQAEELYHVHGQRGEDPTEPLVERAVRVSADHATSRASSSCSTGSSATGHRPFHLPVGVLLDEVDGRPTPTFAVHQVRGLRRLSRARPTARRTRR